MNIIFLSAAALLLLAVLALLLRPLLRRAAPPATASRQALNTAIYRDQLAELERDRAAGSLSESDFDQSRAELQRRLLQDAAVVDVAPSPSHPAWRSAIALSLALPLAAALLYAWLGNPAGLKPPQVQQPGHEVTQAQIEQMVAALAARLEQHPEDVNGWVMLARSYKLMRRFDEAEKAFSHIGDALNSDPVLLTEYADLLATRAGGNLTGKPSALVDEALKLDPENPKALWLAGTAAFNRGDYLGAGRYWESLLKLLPPESEDAKSIAAAIAEARQKSGGKPAADKGVVSGKTVSGRVSLSPALAKKLRPSDTLFIFARAVNGPRIPLAVLRAHAGALPLTFTLDDSLAINPELKLSGANQVKIEARISKSGNATPESGDLVGESAAVKPGAKGVGIVIERAIREEPLKAGTMKEAALGDAFRHFPPSFLGQIKLHH